MEQSSIPLSHGTGAGWQLLGEIELPVSPHGDTIHTWLVELLAPLNLQDDFLKQLLSSAQDATLRALHSNNGALFEHIHLYVFKPSEDGLQRNTWGFFRIEKIDSEEQNNDHPDYAVEFYLYLEG